MVASALGGAGRLVGVGVGPGDPELVTAKALRVLQQSDRVVAPSTSLEAVGRAETIVRQCCPGLHTERLVFEMTAAGPGAEAARHRSHLRAATSLLKWLDAGEEVAFVTLGDPNIYSTFSSLSSAVRQLRPDVAIETVPGVMAFQALAAATGVALLEGTESLALVTALDGTASLEKALEDPDRAVVVYKGGRHLPEISQILTRAGRAIGSVVGELLGLPGERSGPVDELGDVPATYLATVVVPPRSRQLQPPGTEGPGGSP